LQPRRAGAIRTVASNRRLRFLAVAVAVCAVAVIIRTIFKSNNSPQPRYLAADVTLSTPPPLKPPDASSAREAIGRLEPFRAALKSGGKDVDAVARFARSALDAGDVLEARDAFALALRAAPRQDPDLMAGLGQSEARLGHLTAALAAYRWIAERFPLDSRGYLGVCQVEDLLGRRSEAAAELDRALRRLPEDDTAGRLAIASQFEAFGDLARALDTANQALARAPESTEAILLIAHLLIKAERPGDARPLLTRILEREPTNARARYQLGVVLDSPLLPNHDPLRAEDALLTAIEAAPAETPAYRRLIALYEDQNRYRQSAYISLRLLELTPDSAEARLHLANAYAHLGETQKSAEQRTIAVALLDRDAETARLNTLCRQRPADARARLALGRHSLRDGRLLEALSAFQAASVLAPGDSDARRELNSLSARLGLPPPTRTTTE